MNLRRLVLTAAAATLATAAVAPAAHAASTRFYFDVVTGNGAQAEVFSSAPFTRLEVTRNGAPTGSPTTASKVTLAGLVAGDVATIYNGNTVVATAVYQDQPTIGDDACVGKSTFLARRAANAEIVEAGGYDIATQNDIDSFWTSEEAAVVSLKRPLASSDMAYVQTYTYDTPTGIEIYNSRARQVLPCPSDPTRTPPTDPPPPNVPTVTPPELTPTSAQMLAMLKGSLSVSGANLKGRTTRSLARSSTVALPFAFPEPGRVDLQLVAKNTVIGTGAKSSVVNGKAIVTVSLTNAGRKLLKRSKKLKVTLKGAFAASRNGAETSRASLSVTMKG
ncbi:MAG TPA: hypothetical protein VI300_14700 [Solirubrobacter sp.]